MGVHWGSYWYAVRHKSNFFAHGYILLSAYPSYCGGKDSLGNEITSVIFPSSEEYTYEKCANRTQARSITKLTIMTDAEPHLINLTSAIESHRFKLKQAELISKLEHAVCNEHVKRFNEDMIEVSLKKLVILKKFLRTPARELFGSDLS